LSNLAASCSSIPTMIAIASSKVWQYQKLYVQFELLMMVGAFEQRQDQDGTAVPSWSCSKAAHKLVSHIPSLSVQWITPDDGQRNSPKHVEFHFQNKFDKLVHLVCFIIRKKAPLVCEVWYPRNTIESVCWDKICRNLQLPPLFPSGAEF
jgi:hypothetical protein